MDAKTALLQYAAQHNDRKVYTDEQFMGKMATEGVRLADSVSPDGHTVATRSAKMTRSGKTITITETRSWERMEDSKVITHTCDDVVLTVTL